MLLKSLHDAIRHHTVKRLLIFNLLFVLLAMQATNVSAKCVWYGQCGQSDRAPDDHYNCMNTSGPFLQTDDKFLTMFKALCPHLYKGPTATETCCDLPMLISFDKDLSVPKQLMSRCPSCFYNFAAFLCDFTCSPNQDQFVTIKETRNITLGVKENTNQQIK